MNYTKHVSVKASPQMERTPGRTDEVQNSAGGFVHAVDDWARLDRFLILGTEGGTYYVSEKGFTVDNANTVIQLVKSDGIRVVATILKVSSEARAHKNDAAIFALALCAKLGNEQTRSAAYQAMPQICRTGTHLFQFVKFCEALGGWGSGMKRAVQHWYNQKNPDQLAYQMLKYRNREGWTHRDVLRMAHPVTTSEAHRAMFDVTCRPEKLEDLVADGALPDIYGSFCLAQNAAKPKADLVNGLSWEMLPTEWLNDEAVNKQLLKTMPLMATIRQLGRLTANGTIKPLSDEAKMVRDRLVNDEQISRSRIHPMHYLLAAKNYAAGQGFRGSLSWNTNSQIMDALNTGFYKSFANVEPTGKAFLIGVDVSGSMSAQIAGSNISAAEAAGAIAMVIARTESNYEIHGFTAGSTSRAYYLSDNSPAGRMSGFVDLGIHAKDSLENVMAKVRKNNFGRTDCALPMLYALENGIKVDAFVVITDNETWAGDIKPAAALREYRTKVNPGAKLVVLATSASGFSIADPNDAGMLDICGFDAAVPQLIAEFVK